MDDHIMDPDRIMECIEEKFLGRQVRVSVEGEGDEHVGYQGVLNNVRYVLSSGDTVNRTSGNDVSNITLSFSRLEIMLSGFGLSFFRVNDSQKYILCSGLDKALSVGLEVI